MTRDDIIRKVREDDLQRAYERGYRAGIAAEREACAKACDDKAKETFSGHCQVWGDYFARVIRARGNT